MTGSQLGKTSLVDCTDIEYVLKLTCTDIGTQCTEIGCTEKMYQKCMHLNFYVPKVTYSSAMCQVWNATSDFIATDNGQQTIELTAFLLIELSKKVFARISSLLGRPLSVHDNFSTYTFGTFFCYSLFWYIECQYKYMSASVHTQYRYS